MDVQDWIGRSEQTQDLLIPRSAQFMQATLGQKTTLQHGDALPPLWHWLYFLEAKPRDELGRDGHPQKGGFVPPVALPRRMWAGGRFEFQNPLVLGEEATRVSTIQSVQEKEGRSGPLCFVTVRHEIRQRDQVSLTEEHDIVYRADPDPNAPKPTPAQAPQQAEVSEQITPDPTLLFRYSALMFNGHRIHYDVDYARDVEGYEGLVFHGPLTATLLADLAQRHLGEPLKQFSFRGVAPIAGMAPFHIEAASDGAGLKLWARRQDGALAMTAKALA